MCMTPSDLANLEIYNTPIPEKSKPKQKLLTQIDHLQKTIQLNKYKHRDEVDKL